MLNNDTLWLCLSSLSPSEYLPSRLVCKQWRDVITNNVTLLPNVNNDHAFALFPRARFDYSGELDPEPYYISRCNNFITYSSATSLSNIVMDDRCMIYYNNDIMTRGNHISLPSNLLNIILDPDAGIPEHIHLYHSMKDDVGVGNALLKTALKRKMTFTSISVGFSYYVNLEPLVVATDTLFLYLDADYPYIDDDEHMQILGSAHDKLRIVIVIPIASVKSRTYRANKIRSNVNYMIGELRNYFDVLNIEYVTNIPKFWEYEVTIKHRCSIWIMK